MHRRIYKMSDDTRYHQHFRRDVRHIRHPRSRPERRWTPIFEQRLARIFDEKGVGEKAIVSVQPDRKCACGIRSQGSEKSRQEDGRLDKIRGVLRRTARVAHRLSPSALMFGRNIRSTVLTLPSEFKVPDNEEMTVIHPRSWRHRVDPEPRVEEVGPIRYDRGGWPIPQLRRSSRWWMNPQPEPTISSAKVHPV